MGGMGRGRDRWGGVLLPPREESPPKTLECLEG
jgi:hypothetical protein